ncbi:MAG: UDP-N-acetylmuramate dehydrogenase [Opitutales bacterium]
MVKTREHYLFLGVGGMGMAPLAGWMQSAGFSVSGYDDNLSEAVRRWLTGQGVKLYDMLFPEQADRFTTVVYSNAVAAEHPVLVAARARGLRCLRRGAMLAEATAGKRLVAVVGSHGKTTTSGMIGHAVSCAGLDVGYIAGGFFRDASLPPARYSEGEWLVVEVDESDGTIDDFWPDISVVLNLDWDHADYYTDADTLHAAFRNLASRTTGRVLVADTNHLRARFMDCTEAEVLSFGPEGDFKMQEDADGRLRLGGRFPEQRLNPPPEGRFNRLNGCAALVVLHLLGGRLTETVLSDFPGMARRQNWLVREGPHHVVEDYAHHPTEIAAFLESLRARAPDRRISVVFQPHRYSRTRQFKDAFAAVLGEADALFLLPVYPAHEKPLEGGSSSDLAAAFESKAPPVLGMGPGGLRRLKEVIGEASGIIAFVGAGDIEIFAAAFAALLECGFDTERAWSRFVEARVSPECVVRTSEPLARKTTLRVGGAARFYAEPACPGDLRVLLRAAKMFGLEWFCLGRGSNLIVPEEGFDGMVIRFAGPAWRRIESLGEGRIRAAAGVRLKELCGYATRAGLEGFEFLEGIPGSVGGALRMNAGAMGSWMFDVVERVQFLDERGKFRDVPSAELHFGYRCVEEISHGIALGAILRSSRAGEAEAIRNRIDSYASLRKSTQPREPSAGCIFKNPEGEYAGKLIDSNELKGMRVGAAEVSTTHGNFIVNRGGAVASDVIELVRRVRDAVWERSGYELEPEVLLMGKAWRDVLGQPFAEAEKGDPDG